MPCKGMRSQWVQVLLGNWSLQSVAIGATAEATKPRKPLMDSISDGDAASKQVRHDETISPLC